jgi:hypothetical protein
MIDGSSRRVAAIVPAIVVVVLVAGFASASAAAKRSSAVCDARAGATVLEDAQARVFVHHHIYFACSRTSGSVYTLSGPVSGPNAWFDPGSGFELAGSYVAWTQDPAQPIEVSVAIKLVNVDHGPARTAVPGEEQGEATSSTLEDYVLNDDGTLVWLFDGNYGGVGDSPYTTYSYVGASRGRSTLASVKNTNSQSFSKFPISGLGLSSDGKFVFWIDDGKFDGTRIP